MRRRKLEKWRLETYVFYIVKDAIQKHTHTQKKMGLIARVRLKGEDK